MRKQVKRASAATVAAAAAVALTAGLTTSQVAQADSAVRTGQAGATPHHRVQLITGDRVALDAKGRVIGVERAKGRENISVQTLRADGRTYVLPLDARRMLADGTLDRRLFDVAELDKAQNRGKAARGKDRAPAVKVIVGYRGKAATARADVRDAGDTRVSRTLKSLNAEALTAPAADTAALWRALTSERAGMRAAATGVERVWLNGVRKATLDKSTKQIGADKAWAAGYDGKGVKIAVLDTGVDQTHPDLKDQEIAEKNFTGAADAKDRYGHGTHVASIAAGTGAKSGGKFKGVAPGAKILDGKVLDDDGFGDDAGILAGMEWAVAQGADVVNLSLGGPDNPGVDPLEEAVNKLTAEKGTLFAISAGNSGPSARTVGSPGSADAALTVGAVDDQDALAEFSSRGPRIGDGAIKPDVTAPGVDTTAAAAPGSVIDQEVGQNPEGYLTISGTSMAAPHVAGAAALLKQRHPDWKQPELKGALTASTKPGAYSAFEQGSGRIAVDKALEQTVVADPVSVGFGVAQWPHHDDKPITKKVTYRNLGTKDVTLDLSVSGTDPKGKPAPAGFFTLGSKQVTVPAGGTVDAEVTADTRVGTLDGAYSAHVVATGGGQTVRTAAAVEREVESYDVTLKSTGRDGKAAPYSFSFLVGVSGLGTDLVDFPHDPSGTVKLRLPKGGYLLNTNTAVDPDDAGKGTDVLAQPKLDVTKNTTVDLDSRTAKPVSVTVPDAAAKARFAGMTYDYFGGGEWGVGSGVMVPSFDALRTRHLGPQIPEGLIQSWSGQWTKGANAEYDIAVGGPVKQLATGYQRAVKKGELATVKIGLGASAPGRTGGVWVLGNVQDSGTAVAEPVQQKLPGTRTLYVSAVDKVQWGFDFDQYGGVDSEGYPLLEAAYSLGAPQTFAPGKSYEKVFNTGVFGPRVGGEYGATRYEDDLAVSLPVFADGKGHSGGSLYSSVRTTLYRDDAKFAESEESLDGTVFTVPAGDAAYKLTTSVQRDPKVAGVSSRIDASWSFRSKRVAEAQLPLSTVRFSPKLGLDSTAPAGKQLSVPVKVQGAAAGSNLKSLSVYASYDYGKTWTRLPVTGGKVIVKSPAKGKGISFHAKVADKKGNKATVSIYDAYRGK